MVNEREPEQLYGVVTAVLFSNEENGYAVIRVRDENDEEQTCVGCFPGIAPGEDISAYGEWTEHKSYGRQFKAENAERMLPTGARGIFAFLSGGAVKGIGPATASLIVNTFGESSLEVLEFYPEKLAEIKGISVSKAREFSETYKKQNAVRRLMELMCAHSARPVLALRLYRYYGDSAVDIVTADPYVLALPHIGGTFAEADRMALASGFDSGCAQRIRAAAVFELVHNMANGHCFIPQEALEDATARLIGISPGDVSPHFEDLISEGQIIREEINGIRACYTPELYDAECSTAERLAEMSRACRPQSIGRIEGILDGIERENGIHYAPLQKATLSYAAEESLLIVTGGPGTGKTTVTRAIVSLFDALGLKTLLAAPTGRAAKRMTELSGREAATVHRLLGAKWSDEGEKVVFTKNENEKLVCDALVLDECSMMDILLMNAVLKALPEKAKLILVGDVDQLPPVGPGNVFAAMIKSGVFRTVRLTEIFRQSGESYIVKNAHMINRGEYPDFSANKEDFFRLRRIDAGSTADTVAELCSRRLPEKMHIRPEEIQVLSPTRKGETGTLSLNRRLQEALNPAAEGKEEKNFGEIVFREGDRVMQVRNNYDILWHNETFTESGSGMFNGDIGYIRKINTRDELVTIDFDGRITDCPFASLNEIEHSWAVTVHKSQGCEFRAVILVLGDSAKPLLTRSVLYTGVTRAKELLILVGDDRVACSMIDNAKRASRYSFLRTRILSLCGAE